MAVPNIFGTATSAIPLSQLDTNFATPVTIGNTAVQLGNTVTSFGNVTLTNVTISSGNVTITGANVSGTANVSTLVVTGNQTSLGNVTVTGNVSANIVTVSAGSNTAPSITTTGDTNTGIFFPAADTIAFAEGGAEAMRIDSSGNVGIGTSSPAYKLDVVGSVNVPADSSYVFGAGSDRFIKYRSSDNDILYSFDAGDFYQQNIASSYHAWFTGNNERMRIDSSGNLLVGTTSATSKITFKQGADNSSGGMAFVRGDSSNYFYLLTGADNNFYFGYNGSARGVINGATGVYTALSDARLKENVVPIQRGLSSVLLLNPVSYTMVGDETAVQQIGLIAQEVVSVVPEVVSAPTVSNSWYGLNYSGFVPVLIKAIQEQQALIQSLTTRLTALEAK